MSNKFKLWPSILLVKVFAFTLLTAEAAIDFDKVSLETEHVAGNVSMIKMVGGHASNIGVVTGDESVLIVDSQYDEMTERIVKEIKKLSDKPIRFLINTHYHPDHTGGNVNFAKLGVTVVAHENVRKVMANPRINITNGKTEPGMTGNILPEVSYSDSMEINIGGEDIRIFHVPFSHTSGDSFIHFVNSNVLQMGDTYRTTTYPIVDYSDKGSYLGIIKIMDMAIEMSGADTRIIPGHGYISDVNDLKALRDMMVTIRDRVQHLIKQGKSLEQVLAARPTAEFDQRWAFPKGHFMTIDKMLSLFYKELKAQ